MFKVQLRLDGQLWRDTFGNVAFASERDAVLSARHELDIALYLADLPAEGGPRPMAVRVIQSKGVAKGVFKGVVWELSAEQRGQERLDPQLAARADRRPIGAGSPMKRRRPELRLRRPRRIA